MLVQDVRKGLTPGDSLLEDFHTSLIFDKASPGYLQLFTTAHVIISNFFILEI